MNRRRSHHAAVVCNGGIYVMGGSNTASLDCMDCMERIDSNDLSVHDSHWTTLNCRLSTQRFGCCAVAVHNRYIVVIGGFNSRYLSSVDIIDTSNHIVTAGPSMTVPRQYCASAVKQRFVHHCRGGWTRWTWTCLVVPASFAIATSTATLGKSTCRHTASVVVLLVESLESTPTPRTGNKTKQHHLPNVPVGTPRSLYYPHSHHNHHHNHSTNLTTWSSTGSVVAKFVRGPRKCEFGHPVASHEHSLQPPHQTQHESTSPLVCWRPSRSTHRLVRGRRSTTSSTIIRVLLDSTIITSYDHQVL